MNAPEINIALAGHAQHGKSTLAGRLLFEFGGISEEELERLWVRAPAKVANFDQFRKDFNRFNYLFLENRTATFAGGKPDDPSRTAFPTHGSVLVDGVRFSFVDQPGWSRFLGNMIYGLYQADLAIIAVDAKKGIGAGTKRVAALVRYFQIPVIAICVTKMDEVGFAESSFQELETRIRDEVSRPLLEDQDVPIIPVHALGPYGAPLGRDQLPWYQGPDLLSLIKSTQQRHAPERLASLRCAVREVYTPPGIGTVLVGILETGELAVGETLVLEPASTIRRDAVKVRVRSLQPARGVAEPRKPSSDRISARAIVAVATNDLERVEAERLLKHGAMLGRVDDRPPVAFSLEAELVFFRANTVYSGRDFKIRANSCDGEIRITSIEKKGLLTNLDADEYDAEAGEMVRAHIQCIQRPICIESDLRFQRLTRFVLLDGNEIVACGRCLRILVSEAPSGEAPDRDRGRTAVLAWSPK